MLHTALALWSGPALGELAYERFAQDEAARLEELRLTAVEERIEADLRLGRHAGLVAELEGLVREHPLRERLRAQQMLALYRSGRQAEALESFRAARRALVDELGLEPGRELRELEQAILAQDPALDAPRAATPAVRRRGLALIAAGVALGATVAVVAVAVARHPSGADVAVVPDSVAVIDPARGLVVADVPVGARPEALAADDRFVWVANVADGTVQQIDIGKRRVVATIAPEVGVEALAVGGGSAWIADSQRGRALRLDTDLGAVADSVPLPTTTMTGRHDATRPAAALDGGSLWVASTQLAAVLRVDTATRRVVERVDVGNDPAGLAVGAGALWVSDSTDNTVHRIASGAVTDTIPMGNGPGPIAAGAGAIWVANSRDGTVARIDPATRSVKAEIPVGRLPSGIAVGAGAVWVANSLSGTVSRIDPRTNRVTKTIDLGNAPNSLTIAGGRLWVSVDPAAPRPAPAGGRSVLRVLLEQDPGTRAAVRPREPATVARDLRGADDLREPRRLPRRGTDARARHGAPRGVRRRARLHVPHPHRIPLLAALRPAGHRGGLPACDRAGAGPAHGLRGRVVPARRRRRRGLPQRTRADDPRRIGARRPAHDQARRARPPRCRHGWRHSLSAPSLRTRRSAHADSSASRRRGPTTSPTAAPGKRLVLRRNPGYPGPRPQRLDAIEVTIGTPADPRRGRRRGRTRGLCRRACRSAAQARLIAALRPGEPCRGHRAGSATSRDRWRAWEACCSILAGRCSPRAAMRRAVNYALDRRALARVTGRPADRPDDAAGLARLPRRDDLPARRPRPRHRPAPRGRRPAARRALHVQRRPFCLEQAEIVRQNLAAIGIDLDVRRFSFGKMFERIVKPRRAVRRLALWLARRRPRSRAVRRRHVRVLPDHASSSTARGWGRGSAPRAASRAPRGSRPTPPWTARSRRRRPHSPRVTASAHGLLLRAHRLPGRASALRHRPRSAMRAAVKCGRETRKPAGGRAEGEVGDPGFEPGTSSLSEKRSNRLS